MYELSFTPTFYNESLNLPRQVSRLVTQKLRVLAEDPLSANGDAKKLKGYSNVYRARVGDYRVLYSVGQGWVKLLSVRKRDERTYNDQLPEVELPATIPDSAALEPQPVAMPTEYHFLSPAAPEPAPVARLLPLRLHDELLAQWQIPANHWPALVAAATEDALLELAIPERYLTRVLDNLFPRALETIATQPEYVLSQPEDFERLADSDLGAFLLRLTPEQAALVAQDRRGPTLVKGGPGTGKSTLALYRVQRLLDQGIKPILFTTYTNALVAYSEQLLTRLLGRNLAEAGVKVTTIDSLATHYYARAYGRPGYATEGQALECLAEALRTTVMPGANVFDQEVRRQRLERLGAEYLLQELLVVIEGWNLRSQAEYLAAPRRGRRTPLSAAIREAIWAVYGVWRELMQHNGHLLTEQIRSAALAAVQSLEPKPYAALIIDEAQDLSPTALRLLLALVPSPEQVYLTADAAQSLYQRGFSWRQIDRDLQVTGRTLILNRNYRNTAQIMRACASILPPGETDPDTHQQQPAFHEGQPPTITLVATPADEATTIRDFLIQAARQYRLPIASAAVLCTSQQAGKELAQRLTALGTPAIFQSGKQIDITVQQVKVLTLHSAKGLEFPFVAITGLEEGRLPRISSHLPPDEAAAELEEQRRLLYVGCSRAMRALLICGSDEAPSSFLTDLNEPLWQRKEPS
jgi:superfamily I DNA/RNA helicase/mRNA-degrading endonuclease RelE of RelBE toxin-antitoxin system